MTLVDNLSALKQRLVSEIPTKLGVKQYQEVTLTASTGTVYTFTAKVTEPRPSLLANFMSLGVTINGDHRYIECIPLNIPDNAVRYGRWQLEGGITGESLNLNTTGVVDKKVLLHVNRARK